MNKLVCIYFLLFSILSYGQSRSLNLKVNFSEKVDYLIYLPENYDTSLNTKYPLILFLHGGGESGNDIEKVKIHGIPKLIEEGQKFPFVILSPLNPNKKKFWNNAILISLIDSITSKYSIDTNRIYATGMSRGGLGVWNLAMEFPDKFAAIAPVCGATILPYAPWLKNLPIWIFHGQLDKTIPIDESIGIYEYLLKLGADVKLTTFKDVEHNAWDSTYSNPELYKWFLSRKKMIK